VLCEGDKASIEEAVTAAFGQNRVSVSHLAYQLEVGDVVVVLDAVSESRIEPDRLRDFLRTSPRTRLCLSMRPSEGLLAAMNLADRALTVEPTRLTEVSVREYIEAYARADEKRGTTGTAKAIDALLPICRAPDGTYLPLLVRLAMLADAEARTVADIYGQSVETLLRRSESGDPRQDTGALKEYAVALACETYWEHAERVFARDRPAARDSTEALVEAGVLTPAGAHGRELRFFHDSVQSYLAAVALGRRDDWALVLACAAGDERFLRAPADLGHVTISELLKMCLQVFAPASKLRDTLATELDKLASRYADFIAVADVSLALAPEKRTLFEGM
jgi:hypothetical protein